MNEDQFRLAIMQHLDGIAAKLNTTAGHLWDVLIRQAHVTAAINAVEAGVYLAIFIAFARYCKWAFSFDFDGDCWEASEIARFWTGVLGVIASIVVFFCGLYCVETAITALFNPAYWALTKIISGL